MPQVRLATCASALLFWAVSGCAAFNSVRVTALGVAARPPSNVALYVAVSDGDKPVIGLTKDDFTVFENGQPLSSTESKQVLLRRQSVASHRTLLLVDVSAATPEAVRELSAAEQLFVDTVRQTQPVSVYVFDGGPNLRLITEIDRETPKAKAGDLLAAKPEDTSRNLNGAVVEALERLSARLDQDRTPIRVGTLVVFTGGPDLAGRVSDSEFEKKLKQSPHTVLSIGIGEDARAIRDLGKDGYIDAHSKDTISLAFEDAAHRVQGLEAQYYLLSYCSPARAGNREVRVEVQVPEGKDKSKTGSLSTEFDAKGFKSGCDPKSPPRFDASQRSRSAL